MRYGGRWEDGNADKTIDRLASFPMESTQGWQGARGLQVGTSELTNVNRNDVEITRQLENCVEQVKPGLALAEDFEKKLIEIDAGIHGEVSRLMKEEGTVTEVIESSMGQDSILTYIQSNGLNCAVSNGPTQQALVGLSSAHRPNKQLVRDTFTEQAQPKNNLFFASISPPPIKDTNSSKSQGRGPKKKQK
nr:hypothetical protein CFP56_15304 [Quercus suber]